MRELVLKALTAASLGLAAAGVAAAADMPTKERPLVPPPVGYNWSGFYLGINGGYGWGTSKQATFNDTATSLDYKQSGGLVGATFGVQWQLANVVLGFEGDWDYAKIKGSLYAPGVCAFQRCFTNVTDFRTARARIGYAWDRWLFYVTGGVPWGRITAGQNFQDSNCPPGLCGTKEVMGLWVLGGGVEAFVLPKVSLKVEYLHANFGEQIIYSPGTFIKALERLDMVRGGVNYHF